MTNEKLNLIRQDWEVAEKTPEYLVWQFSLDNFSTSDEDVQEINIKYSRIYPYDVKYKHSTSTQNFLRYQNQQPHIDAVDNSQIFVTNLIIQHVPLEIYLDNEGRLAINTLGQGEADIFIAGQHISGEWVKNELSDRTIFYDSNGQEIIFKPGNIWIEVVPASGEVESK